MKTTIAILGIGLIGGSIALSLRRDSSHHIIGFDVHEANINKALVNGIIDEGTVDLQTAVLDADVIIMAPPVEQIRILLRQLSDLTLKEGAIITDVGSTKTGIVDYAGILSQKNVTFIGGHPMAGSHKSGVEAANELLFENAYYVLTPTPDVPTGQVERLQQMLSLTRAHVVVMQPDEHDEVVGAVSHFPHLIAALLVNQVSAYNEEKEWHHRLAAGGFRDITRIASSNPRMWRDILLNNRDYLIKIATDWRQGFENIMALVASGDGDGIEEFFRDARDARDNLPERKRGAIEPLLDLYIDIPDHPGEIGRITTLLGSKQISITNIQIRETREDQLGVLRITFRNERELEKGAEILRYFDYHVYPRE
ncbi:prephenate dehydrogenase [Brevibacillus dissolubilis]|uniref:prephenate dehydrogenase n=1 Tax=Brevibacillus dissolubilis TaxID=1844116 RepID=UPI0011177BE4|nr:prephenate dehydrogenase [Brevibacillus dissolubilis]